MNNKYLTKSKFMIGLECPRKLYYYLHPDIYQNEKLNDPFLEALAQGGFQVGALAKIYHPDGIDLSNYSTEEAIVRTNELLNNENVTIFEAALKFENLLVRVDVLQKIGGTINLYEVKSKSFDIYEDCFLNKKTGKSITSKWEKYIYDLAFQTYVCNKYRPDLLVKPFLTLVNKNAVATVDGLNQKFRLIKNQDNRTKVAIKPDTNYESVGDRLLIDVDAANVINLIMTNSIIRSNNVNPCDTTPFEEKIATFVNGLQNNIKLSTRLDSKCKKCEFRCAALSPLQSGFDECWGSKFRSNDNFIFDVWNIRGSEKIMASGRKLLNELTQYDFDIQEDNTNGLSYQERQWIQVQLSKDNKLAPYIDRTNLAIEINKWKYPLHFIDFETSRVAIPFNIGRKPYEQIAFQFSHHIIKEGGIIEHAGEYINIEPGFFPNFDFVRNLKSQLEKDDGTIFRYSRHENTVLCDILKQLTLSNEPDKELLIQWVKSVTSKKDEWRGEREMVDLYDLVIKFYYHPMMQGSNSLKVVLPTILTLSNALQSKYKQPIYGSVAGIKSTNFLDFAWIQYDNAENILDPYNLLPKLFGDLDEKIDTMFDGDDVKHGGAAMTAYAKLQFTEMSNVERIELRSALLKYCELDTFAMVLLYEYFLDLLN